MIGLFTEKRFLYTIFVLHILQNEILLSTENIPVPNLVT